MQDRAPAIERLGVPAYEWWNESLHGVPFAGDATNFPQVIGMAATWDTPLAHHMAEIISTEACAKYNEAIRQNDHERFFGLTFWAPNINIFRDPRACSAPGSRWVCSIRPTASPTGVCPSTRSTPRRAASSRYERYRPNLAGTGGKPVRT